MHAALLLLQPINLVETQFAVTLHKGLFVEARNLSRTSCNVSSGSFGRPSWTSTDVPIVLGSFTKYWMKYFGAVSEPQTAPNFVLARLYELLSSVCADDEQYISTVYWPLLLVHTNHNPVGNSKT